MDRWRGGHSQGRVSLAKVGVYTERTRHKNECYTKDNKMDGSCVVVHQEGRGDKSSWKDLYVTKWLRLIIGSIKDELLGGGGWQVRGIQCRKCSDVLIAQCMMTLVVVNIMRKR